MSSVSPRAGTDAHVNRVRADNISRILHLEDEFHRPTTETSAQALEFEDVSIPVNIVC